MEARGCPSRSREVSVSGVRCGEAEAPIGQEEAVDPLHLIKGREQD